MLFLLSTLHDVKGACKSSLYRNASEKGTLDELIQRNFIEEVPTPFSNKRTCIITERGKVLFEALVAANTVWTSDPDSEVYLKVTSTRNAGEPENMPSEPIAKTDNDAEEVSEDLEELNKDSLAKVDEEAFVEGVLYDSKGQPIAEKIEQKTLDGELTADDEEEEQ